MHVRTHEKLPMFMCDEPRKKKYISRVVYKVSQL